MSAAAAPFPPVTVPGPVGPDRVKWIKIVPNPAMPGENRVYFQSQSTGTTGTLSHGFFVLSAATLAWATTLVTKLQSGAPFNYTTAPNVAQDTLYDYSDIFTTNMVTLRPVKSEPNPTHFPVTALT